MSTITTTQSPPAYSPARTVQSPLTFRALGAIFALGIVAIHVKDQGGIPGTKEPQYMAAGYWALEIAALVAAFWLVTGRPHLRMAWLLSVGISLGPIVGYCLSRGPGLPDYTDDKGNWTETLGVISLAVEGLLLIVAVTMLVSARRRWPR